MSFLSARGDQLSRGLPYGTGAQLRAYNNQKIKNQNFKKSKINFTSLTLMIVKVEKCKMIKV